MASYINFLIYIIFTSLKLWSEHVTSTHLLQDCSISYLINTIWRIFFIFLPSVWLFEEYSSFSFHSSGYVKHINSSFSFRPYCYVRHILHSHFISTAIWGIFFIPLSSFRLYSSSSFHSYSYLRKNLHSLSIRRAIWGILLILLPSIWL